MWNVIEFDELASTNLTAKELLLKGEARHGDIIQARHQYAGRGRLAGRSWSDEPGSALLMSVVLERLPLPRVELIQYLVAISIAKSLREISPATIAKDIRIKWPNDILIQGRKVSGILSEGLWQSQYLKGVILGIGVNVRQTSFPEAIAQRATALMLMGVDSSVETVRDTILLDLATQLSRLESLPGPVGQMSVLGELRRELEWMTELSELTVAVSEGKVYRANKYEGISDNGGILLRMHDGQTETIHAGTLDLPTNSVT